MEAEDEHFTMQRLERQQGFSHSLPILVRLIHLEGGRSVGSHVKRAPIFAANCAGCHQPPYYTDNLMHNLKAERFYKPRMINGMMASADGPIKTFPLRGIKDSPPYLHDGRLLTLEDAVEFFNLLLETRLTAAERTDLVAFLRAL